MWHSLRRLTNAARRPGADTGGLYYRRAHLVRPGMEDYAQCGRLGAGVTQSLLGKAAVPDSLSYVTGAVGWPGTPASHRMMRECDMRLMVGTTVSYTEYLPTEGQARAVQLDREPRNLALRSPMEVPLQGDAAETLVALLPLRQENVSGRDEWRSQVEGWVGGEGHAAPRRTRRASPHRFVP